MEVSVPLQWGMAVLSIPQREQHGKQQLFFRCIPAVSETNNFQAFSQDLYASKKASIRQRREADGTFKAGFETTSSS